MDPILGGVETAWAADATPEKRVRVLAYAKHGVIDQWIAEDDHTILEVGTAGNSADDKLTDVQTTLFVAIHGPGKSFVDDQAAAIQFWNGIAERVAEVPVSQFWLNFYVGFIEGVISFKEPKQ
jgi:hypothetical protein